MERLSWRLKSFEAGVVGVVADGVSVRRIVFLGDVSDVVREVGKQFQAVESIDRHSLLDAAFVQLEEYFTGRRPVFTLPLAHVGLSGFAMRVYAELRQVPYGEVVTYGELAGRCDAPGAARAVGHVMAANPYPLVIPCHRVVGADGRIGGYSGGRGGETKCWLLDLEKRHR